MIYHRCTSCDKRKYAHEFTKGQKYWAMMYKACRKRIADYDKQKRVE